MQVSESKKVKELCLAFKTSPVISRLEEVNRIRHEESYNSAFEKSVEYALRDKLRDIRYMIAMRQFNILYHYIPRVEHLLSLSTLVQEITLEEDDLKIICNLQSGYALNIAKIETEEILDWISTLKELQVLFESYKENKSNIFRQLFNYFKRG